MSNRQRHIAGFTLIELLVTLVIMSIAAAVLIFQLGALGDNQELQRESRRLVSLLELASEEAALQGRELGVRFGSAGYVFVDLDPDTGAWIELQGDDFLRARSLPEETEFELWLEDRLIELEPDAIIAEDEDDDDDDNAPRVGQAPHVALLSSGETTPFLLVIRRQFDPEELTIRGYPFGTFTIDEDLSP